MSAAEEIRELQQALEDELRRADICDAAAESAIARANAEREAIAAEALRRATALRAMRSWPEADGGAGALEQLVAWIRDRR